MKRFLSLIAALIILFSFTACGGTPSSDVAEPSNVSSGSTDNEAKSQPEPSEQPEETQEPQGKETIEEAVLLDESGVKITAKSLDLDGLFGPEINLLIENNSGSDLTFQCRNSSVNGYMAETMMSVDVMDGKKANDSITFMSSDLESCGISTIADVEFSFHIFTTEGWDTYLDTPQIQLKTSAADTYEYTFDSSGDLAYEGNDIKIIIKGLDETGTVFGPGIVVYIENNKDENITVQARDVSVNGFMADAIFSSEVSAGKHAVDTITFMSSDLEENEISDFESVELSFHIFKSDGWDTIADTDVITITY